MVADEIQKLQRELEEAETDLQESLSEVNHRVAAVDVTPQVDTLIRWNPLLSLSMAAAAGFVVGRSSSRLSSVGALVLGVLFGLGVGASKAKPEEE